MHPNKTVTQIKVFGIKQKDVCIYNTCCYSHHAMFVYYLLWFILGFLPAFSLPNTYAIQGHSESGAYPRMHWEQAGDTLEGMPGHSFHFYINRKIYSQYPICSPMTHLKRLFFAIEIFKNQQINTESIKKEQSEKPLISS